jgi:hypothetical protein
MKAEFEEKIGSGCLHCSSSVRHVPKSKQVHGFTLTFSGTIYAEELHRWLRDSERALAVRKGRSFGVIVDMRYLLPLGPEARAVILDGQRLFKDSGLQRSAVILKTTAITNQFRQLAKDSGVYRFERYIDASEDPEWLEHALAWLQSQIDPDQIPAPSFQR